jgi:hypothetical protein
MNCEDKRKAEPALSSSDLLSSRMKIVLLCAALLITLPSCSSRSSIEELLVGKWETIEYGEDHSQFVTEMVFTKDGVYQWSFQGKPPAMTGRWRLDGKELITTIETQAKDSGLPELPPEIRYQSVRVTERELLITDGTAERRWTRVR